MTPRAFQFVRKPPPGLRGATGWVGRMLPDDKPLLEVESWLPPLGEEPEPPNEGEPPPYCLGAPSSDGEP